MSDPFLADGNSAVLVSPVLIIIAGLIVDVIARKLLLSRTVERCAVFASTIGLGLFLAYGGVHSFSTALIAGVTAFILIVYFQELVLFIFSISAWLTVTFIFMDMSKEMSIGLLFASMYPMLVSVICFIPLSDSGGRPAEWIKAQLLCALISACGMTVIGMLSFGGAATLWLIYGLVLGLIWSISFLLQAEYVGTPVPANRLG